MPKGKGGGGKGGGGGKQQPAGVAVPLPKPAATKPVTPKKLSGRLIESPKYGKVPEEFYEWQPEQQQRFLKLVAEKQEEEEGGFTV